MLVGKVKNALSIDLESWVHREGIKMEIIKTSNNGFIAKSTDSLNKVKSERLQKSRHTDLLVLSGLFSDSEYKAQSKAL